MKIRPNVALLIETAAAYGRETRRGIANYQHTREAGRFFSMSGNCAPPPDWLLDCDGVICRSTTPELAEKLRDSHLPVVDLNDRYGYLGLPCISSDMGPSGVCLPSIFSNAVSATSPFVGLAANSGRMRGWRALSKLWGGRAVVRHFPLSYW